MLEGDYSDQKALGTVHSCVESFVVDRLYPLEIPLEEFLLSIENNVHSL